MNGTNGYGKLSAEDSERELLRTVALCHPGWLRVPAITFAPDMTASPKWLTWSEELFVPVILPAMKGARLALASGNIQALCDCDNAINAALSPDERQCSRSIGNALMESYPVPKGEKLWTRYRALVASGEVPGHLAIVCPLRGATFHLSYIAIVSAYILLEAKGGFPNEGIAQWTNMVCNCLTAPHRLESFNLRAA